MFTRSTDLVCLGTCYFPTLLSVLQKLTLLFYQSWIELSSELLDL